MQERPHDRSAPLSGTGKGTTVDKLKALLPRAVSWSNGNVFRSITLLALAHCEQQRVAFSQAALTPAVLQSKRFVGFSDITALHLAFAGQCDGLGTLPGPMPAACVASSSMHA